MSAFQKNISTDLSLRVELAEILLVGKLSFICNIFLSLDKIEMFAKREKNVIWKILIE